MKNPGAVCSWNTRCANGLPWASATACAMLTLNPGCACSLTNRRRTCSGPIPTAFMFHCGSALRSERGVADLDADLGYNSQNSPVTSTASAGNYSFWAVECIIGYALTPHMDCSFTYHHLERTSNLDRKSVV